MGRAGGAASRTGEAVSPNPVRLINFRRARVSVVGLIAKAREEFLSRAERIESKERLAETIYLWLEALFGEDIAKTIVYHTGGEQVLRDPERFSEALARIFGDGAALMLKELAETVAAAQPSTVWERIKADLVHRGQHDLPPGGPGGHRDAIPG